MGFPPREDSGHFVLGPELGPAEGRYGHRRGAVCTSLACGPAAAVVSGWPRAPGTLRAASQLLVTAEGTQSSPGKELR